MKAHDICAALSGVPELVITSRTTAEDASAAMRQLASFNQCMVGLVRFSGQTPWERHPDDELLHSLEGEVNITVLTDAGPVPSTLRAGSVFVVPRGLWRRQFARPAGALLFVPSAEGNEGSTAQDPRREG